MSAQLTAKLMELAYNAYNKTQSDLADHEIENRLLDTLLGKDLNFTTKQGTQATVTFHSIGRGKEYPSTVVTLQVEGIEFEQDAERLTLDFRYVFYQEYGRKLALETSFLISSPFIQKLGPTNILIEFAIYGNTVNQINRCLSTFADVIRRHQGDRHQTAIDWYDNHKDEWKSDLEINLKKPVREPGSISDPIEQIYATHSDESYIEEYIRYIDDPDSETRKTIDEKNTYAQSKL